MEDITEIEEKLSNIQMDEIISKMKENTASFLLFHEYSKHPTKDFLLSECSDKMFSINAQKLYHETYEAMYRFIQKSSENSKSSDYARAEHSMNELFRKATGLDGQDFNQIFDQMVSLRNQKIKGIKENVKEVYHYSQLDNLVTIKAFEQPVGDNFRTSVGKKMAYASPDENSIYPLKPPTNKSNYGSYAFNHRYKIGYITYGENGPIKCPEDLIDSLQPSYRYTLDAQDFDPCVSLAGIYSKEWKTDKDVPVKKEEGPFTIDDVIKFGYEVYFVSEEHKSDFKEIMNKGQSREDIIQNLDEARRDPSLGIRKYSDDENLQERARKHYEIVANQKRLRNRIERGQKQATENQLLDSQKDVSTTEKISRLRGYKTNYEAPVARKLSQEEINKISEHLNDGR